jgi:hypothetical protein
LDRKRKNRLPTLVRGRETRYWLLKIVAGLVAKTHDADESTLVDWNTENPGWLVGQVKKYAFP